MEKHTFVIKKEVFENTKYSDIRNCAMSTTIREKLHPDRICCTGSSTTGVNYTTDAEKEMHGHRDEFIYEVSQRDAQKVYNTYNKPRNIKVTFRRVK